MDEVQRETLRAQLGREPTAAAFAEATGRDLEWAERVLPELQAFSRSP